MAYAERSAAVLRRAERTPARSGRCSGAETPESAGGRPSRLGILRRKRRFSSALKPSLSRRSKTGDSKVHRRTLAFVRKQALRGLEVGLKARRRRTAAARPGDFGPLPIRCRRFKAHDPSFGFTKREAPRYENPPEPKRFGFIPRLNPGIECHSLTSKLTGPALHRDRPKPQNINSRRT
jgi:hypothetical protein